MKYQFYDWGGHYVGLDNSSPGSIRLLSRKI